jgi:hypothetical protein
MLHADGGLITVQSQRDQEGKEGGTRDIIKIWPYPNKIIRINPDEFYSSVGSVNNVEAHVVSEFSSTIRPVRFLLQALLEGMKPEEMEHLIKRIVKSDPPIFEVPEVIDIDETGIIAVFSSARGAINFAFMMTRSVKPETIRLSLHAGPITIDNLNGSRKVKGSTTKEINAISSRAITGLIYCSEHVAAILVMERQDLIFHPVGRIDFGDEWKEMEIYTIDLVH